MPNLELRPPILSRRKQGRRCSSRSVRWRRAPGCSPSTRGELDGPAVSATASSPCSSALTAGLPSGRDLVGALVRKLRELYTCAGGEECAATAAGEPTTINTPTSAPQTPADALVCDAMGSAALGDDYCQMCLGYSVFCPRCTTAQ